MPHNSIFFPTFTAKKKHLPASFIQKMKAGAHVHFQISNNQNKRYYLSYNELENQTYHLGSSVCSACISLCPRKTGIQDYARNC